MTTTIERPDPPAVLCKPWCIKHDGHPDEAFREDQYCYTDELYVPLSRPGELYVDDKLVRPARLHVSARHDPDAVRPTIVVNLDGGQAPEMTLEEAQALIEALQLLIGQVSA